MRASDQHTIIAGWLAQLRHDEQRRRGHRRARRSARVGNQTSAKQPAGRAASAGWTLGGKSPRPASAARTPAPGTRAGGPCPEAPPVCPRAANEGFNAATLPGQGSFRCDLCGYRLTLHPLDRLPQCPHCGRGLFRRSSIFTERIASVPWSACDAPVRWLSEARARRQDDLDQLFYEDRGVLHSAPLQAEWTHIGRARSADLRLDDPTVSRRHAIVRHKRGGVHILDDRSLNGILVAGRHVIDSVELHDGDPIEIGRFCLCLVRATSAGQGTAA